MNKKLYYTGITLLIIFIVFYSIVGVSMEDDSFLTIRLALEWTTRFVLPWIFLYWFIQLVKKIK
ncbi:hypothetical protein [Paenibacillus lemnae]|uniref:Uncharacterized protein n=1 Tax=Paenibacillus lemnae TaxID=1330551 RepID=A0A848MB95_PAELE|nr:hypothetical protein [Paenibacillus lemnae]NMO96724.1 hypothetical protein [Paenibacillus lemnae]